MTFEQQLLNFLNTYGFPILIISCIIILVIGTLKYFNAFAWIKNSDVKKFSYYFLDVILSFGFVAIYYAIFKLDFSTYVVYCLKTIPAVTTLYAIYENFGLRKFLAGIGNFIVSKVAKSQVEKAKIDIEKTQESEVKTEQVK